MKPKSRLRDFIFKEWILLSIIIITFSGVLGVFGFYLSLIVIPILSIKRNLNTYFDYNIILLIIFSFTYAIFSTFYGFNMKSNSNLIFFIIYPSIFYITGRYLIRKWYDQKYFILLLLVIPIGITSVFDIFRDIGINGFVNPSRSLISTGNLQSATLIGVNISLYIASIGLLFAKHQNEIEKKYRILLVILGVLGIVSTMHLINRTGIVIGFVSIILIYLKEFRHNKFMIVSLSIIVVVAVIQLYPKFKNEKIYDEYALREVQTNYNTISAGGRIERWSEGLNILINNPFGGGDDYNRRRYAHNFWLDIGVIGGILPFFALIIATVIHFRKTLYIIRSNGITSFFAAYLIVLNSGFFLQCFVEPIMEGKVTYALIYFFFWGMTSELYSKVKSLEQYQYRK